MEIVQFFRYPSSSWVELGGAKNAGKEKSMKNNSEKRKNDRTQALAWLTAMAIALDHNEVVASAPMTPANLFEVCDFYGLPIPGADAGADAGAVICALMARLFGAGDKLLLKGCAVRRVVKPVAAPDGLNDWTHAYVFERKGHHED